MQIQRDSVCLLGVRLDSLSLEELLAAILKICREGRKAVVAYANIHALNLACDLAWFRSFLNSSEIVFCDGLGLMLAAFLLGKKIKYRYTPPDFIHLVCKMAAENGMNLFFLGGRPGVAEKAARRMKELVPSLQIAAYHGFFDKHKDRLDTIEVIQRINAFHTDILVVGFGMPLQEEWISENFGQMNVKIAFPVGALFDYISKEVKRAPRWMTDHGLEWLGRLAIEPRRLWKRYIIGIPLFFWRVFVYDILRLPLPQ